MTEPLHVPGNRVAAPSRQRTIRTALPLALVVSLLASGCGGDESGEIIRVRVPRGASFSAVTDSLAQKEIIQAPGLFRIYARLTGADRNIKPGTYGFRKGTGWKRVLDDLHGVACFARLVIPEADLRKIAPRLPR